MATQKNQQLRDEVCDSKGCEPTGDGTCLVCGFEVERCVNGCVEFAEERGLCAPCIVKMDGEDGDSDRDR